MRGFILVMLFVAATCRAGDELPTFSSERVEQLWHAPGTASAEELFTALFTTSKAKDLERSVFFLWCAQVRLQFERQMFPPKQKGGDSPTLLFYATGQVVGQSLIPKLYASPDIHRKVVTKFSDYIPECTPSYQPLWDFERGEDKRTAQLRAKNAISAIIAHSGAVLQLTAIPEYLDSLKVYSDTSDESKDRPDRLRAANEVMRRVEEQKKIESGLVYIIKKNPNHASETTAPSGPGSS